MRLPSSRTRAVLILGAAALLLTACGDDGGSSTSSTTAAGGAGALVHVDGLVAMTDAGFELDPPDPGRDDVIRFTSGPAVKQGVLRALAASGTPTRVTYRLTEDAPIAVTIVPAPRIEGLDSYVGTIDSVTATRIVLDGDDGARTFAIAAADAAAFDTPHLQAHRREHTPVRVYFDPKHADQGIAYEDA